MARFYEREDKKLIFLLDEHKNKYNKELNALLEKNQIQSNISNVLIEQFENENYLNDFSKKFIPLIVKQLMIEKKDVITNYLPHILAKYQLFIKGEVVRMKTYLEEDYRELIKK